MIAPQTWGRASMGSRFRSAAVRLSASSRMPGAISSGLDFLGSEGVGPGLGFLGSEGVGPGLGFPGPDGINRSGDLGLNAGGLLQLAERAERVAADPLL